MSLLTILKIASYIATAGVPVFLWIRSSISNKKKHKEELEAKDSTIKSLRESIFEMVELEGEKKDVEKKRKKIAKDIDSMSDDELAIAYANKLPDMPRKGTRRTRKKS